MSICLGAKNKLVYYLGMPEKPLTQPRLIGYGQDVRTAILDMSKQIYAILNIVTVKRVAKIPVL